MFRALKLQHNFCIIFFCKVTFTKFSNSLQKERNSLLENVGRQRAKARNELLKNLNPLIENYMQEKKIRLVIDKKNIILSDEKLDITNDIMKALNAKIKSIKLN